MAKHSTTKADWLRQLREDQAKARESRGGPEKTDRSKARVGWSVSPRVTDAGSEASSPRVITKKRNRDVGGSLNPIVVPREDIVSRIETRTTGKQDQVAPVSEGQTIVADGSSRVISDKPRRGPKKGTGGRPRVGDVKDILSHTKPWVALGMSQSTWYRRKRNENR